MLNGQSLSAVRSPLALYLIRAVLGESASIEVPTAWPHMFSCAPFVCQLTKMPNGSDIVYELVGLRSRLSTIYCNKPHSVIGL
jgi:hypothetical protein